MTDNIPSDIALCSDRDTGVSLFFFNIESLGFVLKLQMLWSGARLDAL